MNQLPLTVYLRKKNILQLKENWLSCREITQSLERSRLTISFFLEGKILTKNLRKIETGLDTPRSEQIKGWLALLKKQKCRKPLDKIQVDFYALNSVKLSKSTWKDVWKIVDRKEELWKKNSHSKGEQSSQTCIVLIWFAFDYKYKLVESIFSDKTQVVLGKDRKMHV